MLSWSIADEELTKSWWRVYGALTITIWTVASNLVFSANQINYLRLFIHWQVLCIMWQQKLRQISRPLKISRQQIRVLGSGENNSCPRVGQTLDLPYLGQKVRVADCEEKDSKINIDKMIDKGLFSRWWGSFWWRSCHSWSLSRPICSQEAFLSTQIILFLVLNARHDFFIVKCKWLSRCCCHLSCQVCRLQSQ